MDERTGEGMRAPHPGEANYNNNSTNHQHHHNSHHHHYRSSQQNSNQGGGGSESHDDGSSGGYNGAYPQGVATNYGGGPSTPHIRTPKELEMTVAMGRRLGHGAPTILYSHANAEDLGNIYPWGKFLSKMLGVNIFAYDYTGYGLASDQGKCF